MSTIEMYKPKYEVVDIFKALKKLNPDDLLPEEGVFDFFYQNSLYPGVSLYLRHKNKTKLFYVDHDDIILEIKEQTPEWNISIDKNLVRISLVYKLPDSNVSLSFVFDISDANYVDLLAVIRKNKEVKLYFLTMLYGGLVFDSYKKFKVPSEIIKVLNKIK